jgi:hypothetical protein
MMGYCLWPVKEFLDGSLVGVDQDGDVGVVRRYPGSRGETSNLGTDGMRWADDLKRLEPEEYERIRREGQEGARALLNAALAGEILDTGDAIGRGAPRHFAIMLTDKEYRRAAKAAGWDMKGGKAVLGEAR